MILRPFITWRQMALITFVPVAVALVLALVAGAAAGAIPALGSLVPGIAGGALAVLPVNLAAVMAAAFALALSNAGSATASGTATSADATNPAIALVGIIAGMAVRVVGSGLIALTTSQIAPAHLATTLSTVCVLLLAALVGETLLYARRLLAPSIPESARA